MKNNKKGLSTIVATLLIILLTLVAVGIIWIVVRNVIQGGASQVDLSSKCLDTEVAVTKVTNASAESFSTTITRKTGENTLGGVKLVYTNAAETGNFVYDVQVSPTVPLTALSTATVNVPIPTATLANPNKVSIVAYFLDESGNQQLCQTASQYSF